MTIADSIAAQNSPPVAERDAWFCDLGRMSYREAFALQQATQEAQLAGRWGEGLFFVEHPPVITMGRRSQGEHLTTPTPFLAARGIEVCETDRGGQLTYHGPGQIVAYPLMNLTAAGLGVHAFVRALEEAVIQTLGDYGIAAERVEEYTGVWVGNEKICAIGLRVRKWWSLHGLAFNVAPDLGNFRLFVPCGITDRGVTSLSKLLGRAVPPEEVKPRLRGHLARLLGLRLAQPWDAARFREEFVRAGGVIPPATAGIAEGAAPAP